MLGALELNKKDILTLELIDKIPVTNGDSEFVHTLNVNHLSVLANDPSKTNSKPEAVLILDGLDFKQDCSMTIPSNLQQQKEEKHATETDCFRNEPNEAQRVTTVKCSFSATETEAHEKEATLIDFTKSSVIPKTEQICEAPDHQNLGHVKTNSPFGSTSEQSVPFEVTSNLSLVKTDENSLPSTISQQTQSVDVKYDQRGAKISRLKIPLSAAIILFGCCEVQLRRCDHLVRKLSKVKIRRSKKPGPKSKTMRTECEIRESVNTIVEKVLVNLDPEAEKKTYKNRANINNISPNSSEKRRKLTERKKNLKKITHLGLVNRMRVQSDNQPYKCSVCGLGFANRPNCTRHMRVKHPGVIPPSVTGFKCSSCGKRFMTRVDLKSHLVQHADVKLYDCNLCGSRFTQQANLSRHKRESCKAKDQPTTNGTLEKD